MSMTIYKYIMYPGRMILNLPKDAAILSVQMQGGYPCLWALQENNQMHEERVFHTYGTGNHIPDTESGKALVHVATYQDAAFVWHVFEEVEVKEEEVSFDSDW